MKTFKTLGTILLVCMIGLNNLNAQSDYQTGIGFRAGPMPGLSVKHFISDEAAIEGILSSRWRGTIFHGLYEIHQDVFSNNNFNFYYGAGAHFGYWDLDGRRHPWYDGDGVYSAFGVDGIVGLEYSFDEIPFSLSLDWKPMFNLIEHTRFWMDDFGLTVRFNIGNNQ